MEEKHPNVQERAAGARSAVPQMLRELYAAGYRYSIEAQCYVNRDLRRIASVAFVEHASVDELRDRLTAPAGPNWDFCFTSELTDAQKREILAKLGVKPPPAPTPTLEGTVMGAGLMLLWRPLTIPQPGDVLVQFCAMNGGDVEVITRGRFPREVFDALVVGLPGATVVCQDAGQGQI